MDLTRYKLALLLVAAVVIGYGIRAENRTVVWVGVALLGAAFMLRFFQPRAPR